MSRKECPAPQPDCKYAELKGGCFSDVHHLYYPSPDYRTKTEKDYRELPHHKIQICRALHDAIHALEQPPTKPPVEEMVRAIASHAMRDLGETA